MALALLSMMAAAGPAQGHCTPKILLELPVTMDHHRPLIPATINGHDVVLLVDSGAFFSSLSRAATESLQLDRYPAPFVYVQGSTGKADVEATRVNEFGLGGAVLKKIEFIVGGSVRSERLAGILGQNLLGAMDLEYDFANGVMRFIRAGDCKDKDVVYWSSPLPASVVPMQFNQDTTAALVQTHHDIGMAMLNGAKISVLFDTGAAYSFLATAVARRAGITPDSQGVTPAGRNAGVGGQAVDTWIGPFASFRVGDEELGPVRLRFGNIIHANAEMLLGIDFFLTHRVYMANSQHRIYFTRNGAGSIEQDPAVPDPPGESTPARP